MKIRFIHTLILATSIVWISSLHSKPPVGKNFTIRIQPFAEMNSNLIASVADSIRKMYPNAVVAPKKALPVFAYHAPRNRYKADSILTFLQNLAKPNEIWIGITTKDISTKKGEYPDWGVMGLAYRPGNACVVSTFRLKKENLKHQLFKVSIHELGHTMGLPHCSIPSCFMRDAEGGNPMDEETGFCKNCAGYLKEIGWRL